MTENSLPEVWLRGAIPGIPPLLQPVSHALLQAAEEVRSIMSNFPEEKLWERPAGLASAAFHLQHLPGVLDRLFTYARGEMLNPEQLKKLAEEGMMNRDDTVHGLVDAFGVQVGKALDQLRATDEATLIDYREVGRKRLPSTVLGLLVHAAEHTQRHVGQLLVTARILRFDY
ncbi:MAG TPA: DinB family protein [Puia sp.]|nr:DinB family protein [Puia sp.]